MHRWTVAFCLVCVVGLVSCAGTTESTPPSPPARVVEVEGEVTQEGRALAVGDTISLAATIEVKTGRAVLELPGRGQLRLFPRTRARAVEPGRLRLLVGKVWALINVVAGTTYVVETNNAVAGVRGTEFVVEAAEAQTVVAVMEGVVDVADKQQPTRPTVLRPGQRTTVVAGQPPATPVVYDPVDDQRQWESSAATPDQIPTPPIDREPRESSHSPGLTPQPPGESAPGQRAPGRVPLRPHEQEGEKTRQELRQEGEQTKKALQQEEQSTREALQRSEAATRRRLEEEARRAKEGGEAKGGGSVKDFLE